MEQSSAWKADSGSYSRKVPRTLRIQKFCTLFVKDPTLSLSQLHILILSKSNYIFPSMFMFSKRLFHFRKKSSIFSDTNQHVTPWGMLDTSQQDRQCTCNLTLRRLRVTTYDSHTETTGVCLLIGKILFVFFPFDLCTFHTVTNTLLYSCHR
jgi:hypothetical protein